MYECLMDFMQNKYIIPMKCRNCRVIFDEWQDLVDNIEIDESFCRTCRVISIFELMDNNPNNQ